MHIIICGGFCSNKDGIAGYIDLNKIKIYCKSEDADCENNFSNMLYHIK
ncbi:MAG: hypothetical protein ACLSF3_11400 [Anaerobutyricum hallii]